MEWTSDNPRNGKPNDEGFDLAPFTGEQELLSLERTITIESASGSSHKRKLNDEDFDPAPSTDKNERSCSGTRTTTAAAQNSRKKRMIVKDLDEGKSTHDSDIPMSHSPSTHFDHLMSKIIIENMAKRVIDKGLNKGKSIHDSDIPMSHSRSRRFNCPIANMHAERTAINTELPQEVAYQAQEDELTRCYTEFGCRECKLSLDRCAIRRFMNKTRPPTPDSTLDKTNYS